jgi:hypothetical protein
MKSITLKEKTRALFEAIAIVGFAAICLAMVILFTL